MQLNSYDVSQLLFSLASVVPFLIIDFVGIVLSVVWRKRMGKAWFFSLAGFLLLFGGSLLQIGFQIWLNLLGGKSNLETLKTALYINAFAHTILAILGMILILIAIFSGRKSAENRENQQ